MQYLVVEGPIGVGKTTLAKKLATSLGASLLCEGQDENPFLSRFYEDQRNYALSTQLFFLMQRAKQIQALRQGDLFTPLCVADFMLEKDRLFALMNLDGDELALYDQIYEHLTLEAPTPDLVIYLQASVGTLLQRVSNRARDYESDMQAAYLRELSGRYSDFFSHYSDAPVLVVDSETVDLVHQEEDYETLLRLIDSQWEGQRVFQGQRPDVRLL